MPKVTDTQAVVLAKHALDKDAGKKVSAHYGPYTTKFEDCRWIAWHRKFCSAVICIFFAGCAAQTESRAIEQANAAARAEGYDLGRYEAQARYNLSGDGVWTVFYNPRRNARIGDDFFVTVNRAGTGTLAPGH